jgi:hypothetical protein
MLPPPQLGAEIWTPTRPAGRPTFKTLRLARLPLLHLYIDESGSRHPDKAGVQSKRGDDWFSIGGVLIEQEREAAAKAHLAEFKGKWPQIRVPLHMTDMNSEKKGFAWIGKLDDERRTKFWTDLRTMLALVPVAGAACVIDRPGYNARGYGSRAGDAKWLLCRSAFDILIDRSAKFAKSRGRRLRVFYERSDPTTDQRVESYFQNIRDNGLAFDANTSARYRPMPQAELKELLLDIEGKPKENRIMQIADSYIYAISRGSYNRKFHVYRRMLEAGKLITSQVPGEDAAILGIKKYCFP